MQAPGGDKKLSGVIVIDAVGIGRGELNLGARGPKVLLRDGRTESVGRDALDPDEHSERE